MPDLTNISNSNTESISGHYISTKKSEDLKETQANESVVTTRAVTAETSLEEIINNDPQLKALYNKVVANYSDKPPEVRFSIRSVIAALIDLNQALQGAVTANADRLSKITEKLNAYAQRQSQIPVIMRGTGFFDGDNESERAARGEVNQKFAQMLESIRAYKGIEEDKAKKVQSLLQSMKDAGSSVSDFISTFIDLFRGIGQKITQ